MSVDARNQLIANCNSGSCVLNDVTLPSGFSCATGYTKSGTIKVGQKCSASDAVVQLSGCVAQQCKTPTEPPVGYVLTGHNLNTKCGQYHVFLEI